MESNLASKIDLIKSKPIRFSSLTPAAVLSVVLCGTCLTLLYWYAANVLSQTNVTDFAAYWTAARLADSNPYDTEKVTRLELSLAKKCPEVMVMRNPPWAIPLLLPLRFVSYGQAYGIWMLLNGALLWACSIYFWRYYRGRDGVAAVALGFCFGPALINLVFGQTSMLILAGLALFLSSLKEDRDWVGACGIFLMSIKPQILFCVLLVIALWCIRNRPRVLVYSSLLIAVNSGIACLLDPSVFSHYMELLSSVISRETQYQNLSTLLPIVLGFRAARFLPSIVAVLYCVYYFVARSRNWDWRAALPQLLVLSVATFFYTHTYDDSVLLPAFCSIVVTTNRKIFLPLFVGVSLVTFGAERQHWFDPGLAGVLLNFWPTLSWIVVYAIGRYFNSRTTYISASRSHA